MMAKLRLFRATTLATALLMTVRSPMVAESAAATKAIYTTIRTDDLKGLKSLVSSAETANIADETLTTPLMYAAQNALGITALMWSSSNVGKVRLLLSHDADPNKATQIGRTAMTMAAASSPSSEILKMLMAKGANAKAKGTFGGTALNMASLADDMGAIRLLIEAGADINAAGMDHGATPGGTPLMNAAANGNLEAVTSPENGRKGKHCYDE
jgi:ankyrin repeat protein